MSLSSHLLEIESFFSGENKLDRYQTEDVRYCGKQGEIQGWTIDA